MMAHPLALQLRNLQTLVEIAVDKNSTVVFPAPLMSTIQELGAFRGGIVVAWRLLRCNPLSNGGIDDVADRKLFRDKAGRAPSGGPAGVAR